MKVVAFILVLVGSVGLFLGVPGVFGPNLVAMNPWLLASIGFIFFGLGVVMFMLLKEMEKHRS